MTEPTPDAASEASPADIETTASTEPIAAAEPAPAPEPATPEPATPEPAAPEPAAATEPTPVAVEEPAAAADVPAEPAAEAEPATAAVEAVPEAAAPAPEAAAAPAPAEQAAVPEETATPEPAIPEAVAPEAAADVAAPQDPPEPAVEAPAPTAEAPAAPVAEASTEAEPAAAAPPTDTTPTEAPAAVEGEAATPTIGDTATGPAPTEPAKAAAAPPSMGGFESGEIISGTVTVVTKNELELDLGEGRVGTINSRHWASGLLVDLTGEATVGDVIEGAVLARPDVKQRIVLSRVWARQKRAWEAVEDSEKNNTNLTATVVDVVKGGLSLDAGGLRAFMPASLVDVEQVADLEPYVGQQVECRVIEADRVKARLIVSRKAALRAQARSTAREALGTMEVGHEAEGTVVQITEFGAFVDVNGIRGLVHRSELGWKRYREVSDAVSVGQKVKVRVVKVQPSKNRLGLSMKFGGDPLKTIKAGERHTGTVSRLVDFGAFVRLDSGVEGLVHVSELAEYRVYQPEEVVMPGEEVTVKVLKVDKKRRTIDLSIREALIPDLAPAPVPEPVAAEEPPAPAIEEAPVAEEAPVVAETPTTEEPAAVETPAPEAPAADDPAVESASAQEEE